MSANQNTEEWLVRMATNQIEGPMDRDEVLAMVSRGELGPMDELCKTGSYWIPFRDHKEIEEAIGMSLPFLALEDRDDTTATDLIRTADVLITDEQTTVFPTGSGKKSQALPGVAKTKFPPAKKLRPKLIPTLLRKPEAPKTTGIESTTFWRATLGALVILSAILFGALMRVVEPGRLRNNGPYKTIAPHPSVQKLSPISPEVQ